MEITDKTNQKSDNLTFKVGDVVKAVFDNKQIAFILIVEVAQFSCHAVQLNTGGVWNHTSQTGSSYTFDKSAWHYTKVNAELIITD